MIIRKPYAFLIKNFKKIHIVLLILSLLVAYKIIDVSHFVNQFINNGTYDSYADPITNHINNLMMVSIFIIIIGSGALLLLLRHKRKPWKVYLIPVMFYVALFLVLNIIKGFFNTYSVDVQSTDIRMARDLMLIFIFVQLPVLGIFIMRVLGLDLGKFNFSNDQEFLELSDTDREEVELSLDFDTNSLKRLYKKTIRNFNYIYSEHKMLFKILFTIIFIVSLFNIYKLFFVTNKVYKIGDNYNYNEFTINVSDSYVAEMDYKHDIISKNSKFIILNVSVKNNSSNAKKFNTSNFHIKAINLDYSTTETTFAKEFSDIGSCYSKVKSINGNQNLKFIIIFKVDKKINNNKFVLYFQEKNNSNKLRKIKLKLKDIDKLDDPINYKLGEFFKIETLSGSESISFDEYDIVSSVDYSSKKCSFGDCDISLNNYSISEDNKIMVLDFASDSWEAKNMIDFFDMYGKINYKDSSGEEEVIDVDFALKNKYFGKLVYLKVPNEILDAQEINLDFVLRNKEYIYKLK